MHNDKKKVVDFLNLHLNHFEELEPIASETRHQVPTDTKFFSQILASLVTGIRGIERKKGADLSDGSDVKAALVWEAIDTPRFNGCLKAGTKSSASGNMKSLDEQPFLFLIMWDEKGKAKSKRVRIWSVNTKKDALFRNMALAWYKKRDKKIIKSNNFQLHPPRNKDSNEIRNTCGNLNYPLMFEAVYNKKLNSYEILTWKKDYADLSCSNAL